MAVIINAPTQRFHTYLYQRPKAIAPIVIANMLTLELHGFATVLDATDGLPYFDFNNWVPAIYDIINNSGQLLPVLLFNITYPVNNGEIWRFVAHDEIETHNTLLLGAGGGFNMTQPPTNLPYWDPLLGGSFWDNYQSPWDGGRL